MNVFRKQRMTGLIILIILSNFYGNCQSPQILWWFDVDDSCFGQPAMADITGNGRLDIVFGCYRNDSMVYALNGLDGSLIWKHNTSGFQEGCNDAAVLFYDIDKDGILDAIVPSSCQAYTYCFDGSNGSIKWQTYTIRGSDSPPSLSDLDGDGIPEIIHGQFGGYVICLNPLNGDINWNILVDSDSWIQTAPTVLDLDGDGLQDFVVASWNFSGDSKLYAFRGYDQTLIWTYDLDAYAYHGTAVADLDNDGIPELILGDYNGTLHVVNSFDGQLKWSYQTGSYIGSPVSVADLNGDGSCELVFSTGYKVMALNKSGTQIWEYQLPNFGQAFRGCALSDIDNDSLPDVIFGTSKGELIALNGHDGNLIWSVNLASHLGADYSISSAPIIGDLNNNGLLDVFVLGGFTEYPNIQNNYGRAYALEIGPGFGPQWPMFQLNIERNSSLCQTQLIGINNHFYQNLEFEIYPNPLENGSRLIVELENEGQRTAIQITDITGRSLFQFNNQDKIFEIPYNFKQSGVYIIQGIQKNRTAQKILLVK